MKFRYWGVTRQNEKVKGNLEASDESELRLRLRTMQIRMETARPAPSEPFSPFSWIERKARERMGGKVKLKQLILFTRQLSSLIDSGVPVVQCLDILCQQEKKGLLKNVLAVLKQDIEAGSGLAIAMQKHPRVFSEFFVRIVEAGEMSGTLDKAIRQVGSQLDKLDRMKAKVIKALMYPGFTLVVAFGVLVFLIMKVVPEIAKLYSEGNATLPDLTLFVLGMSHWFQNNFHFVIGGVAGLLIGSSALYRLQGFRKLWDPFVLKLPLFGALILKSAVAQLTRTLGTLVSSGVPLLAAFEICRKLMTNLAIKETIRLTMSYVSEGRTIAAGLGASNVYPPMVIHMVNIGEMTGRLDELLGKVAGIYDDEVDDAVSNLTGLLQPAIIVVVGVLIAFLLVSMYLPIFQLAEKVTGQ